MIVLYNPLSTTPGKQPLPLSLMSLAAVLEGRERFRLVDGNLERDPAAAILKILRGAPRDEVNLLAATVMPGPQLTQAVSVSKRVRESLPGVPIVWGGYFPTQHGDTVLKSHSVDFVVRSQGEMALLDLLEVLRSGGSFSSVSNLSWKDDRGIHQNPLRPPTPLDELPDLPYHLVSMDDYLHRDYLGSRTAAHNSSFGCPFACNFCAVVAMSNQRWLGQSAERMERVLRRLVGSYGVDAVQMHDMDFFVSETRTAEFSDRIADLGIRWWGLGRVDTLMRYSEETFRKMARSGLKMVFSGAESGSDETLARMNKGGTASAELALDLARRMREHGIVPEYSFVLGSPPDPEADTRRTFEFIRRVKRVNPATEVVLYVYTPVALEGTLYDEARRQGFAFPETL
ncbi:MAG TPA: radical SAM protein, partial [Vicinamibacteria bacterium]|nr:radical SAM protein [Vicinamibacteria bacterium]